MRFALLAATLLLGRLAVPALASDEVPVQRVTPITPSAEQRIEPIGTGVEQHVEALDATGAQQVMTPVTKGPLRRAADGVARVMLVVVGATIAVGVTIASVLFV